MIFLLYLLLYNNHLISHKKVTSPRNQIIVDGTPMPDPGTVSFFGAGRWGSGIEIPSADMDFWQVKDVPQGSIVEKYYWSKATAHEWHTWRRSLYEFAQKAFK